MSKTADHATDIDIEPSSCPSCKKQYVKGTKDDVIGCFDMMIPNVVFEWHCPFCGYEWDAKDYREKHVIISLGGTA